jgi:hypothetical protein
MPRTLEQLMDTLARSGWEARLRRAPRRRLPRALARFGSLPAPYRAFLLQAERCVDPEQRAWLLTCADFEGRSGSAFTWDAWERLSLSAARGDAPERKAIRAFWDRHLPVALSVRSGYAYLALRLTDGAVVLGCEPEFEESPERVCPTFSDLLTSLRRIAAGRPPSWEAGTFFSPSNHRSP